MSSASTAQTIRRQAPPKAWKPGQSGNPRGRPPAPVDIAALAREHGPRCIAVAAELLDDPDSRIRLGALTALLDRGFGKPRQTIETNDPASPGLLHLLAAETISQQIVEAFERREQPATIKGCAEPAATAQDLLTAPTPLE
jgi:hypothetical protein